MNVLRRGSWAVAVLSSLSLAASSFAAIVPAVPSELDARVTVSVRHAPLGRLLDTLSAQAKVNFILADGLEQEKVTAFLHDVTVADALDVLHQTKGIEFKTLQHGATYLIAPKGSPLMADATVVDAGPSLDKRVTIAIKGGTLGSFLDALSSQTKADFTLEDSAADRHVTAFLTNVTAKEALEIVLTIKGLSCRRLKGREVYAIGPVPAR